ncbi:MAG: DMT family transporter [Vitreoscilla sp.]|nr:DMT family transporter [Polaromonas sp.]
MQAVWMILSAFIFSTMAVCVKFAAVYFNNAELVFYRGVIGVVFMWFFAEARGTSLATTVLPMHVWRSVVGVVALSAWFYAIAHLPLATAMTLNYMSSVWIAAFLVGGTLMFARAGERIQSQGPLVAAILASFAGVVMLLRPTIAQNQAFAGLIGLLSGLGAAFAYMQVMVLARMGEPEARTVFYFAVGTAIAGALGMALMGVSPWDWQHALWLLPIGLLASLGQLCMTKAYSMSTNHGGTLMAANLQYSGIIFSALYGLALFGDQIPLLGWVGMALIMLSAVTATILRARSAPNAPAEEH